MTPNRTLTNILFSIAVLCGAYLIFASMPNRSKPVSELIGKPAPVLSVSNIESSEVFELKKHLGKKVFLINFWATWCSPCREEIPLLNQLHEKLPADRFEIIAIMEDDAPSREILLKSLQRFSEKIPIKFPVFIETGATPSAADAYGTYMIPESYLIDLGGNVAYKHSGPITKYDLNTIESEISRLMNLQIEAKLDSKEGSK